MKYKIKNEGEPRKNKTLRDKTRLPLDWHLLATVTAFKPW